MINPSSSFPEGPLWHAGQLYYVEYSAHTVMARDGKENRQVGSRMAAAPRRSSQHPTAVSW